MTGYNGKPELGQEGSELVQKHVRQKPGKKKEKGTILPGE